MGGLGDFIAKVEKSGEVLRLKNTVSPLYEAAAVLAETGARTGQVVVLENVEGHRVPVVGNVFGRVDRVARILGTENVTDFCLKSIKPLDVEYEQTGPCQDKVFTDDFNILDHLPVLTHFDDDAGPYITNGMLIAKRPGTDKWSMGIHRLQVKGGRRLGVLLASPPVCDFLKEAESSGLPLEIAIAVGVEPVLLLASVMWSPEGSNKAEFAGGIAGHPFIFTRGVSVDVPVPADAEFVLEGRIMPGVREPEGPFGEETGVYTPSLSPVIELSALTCRKKPVYQALVPFTGEGRTMLKLATEIALNKTIMALYPQVKALRVSSLDWTSVAVQVNETGRHTVREIIDYLFNVSMYIKSVVVVDEDVDPDNPEEVSWAVSTRCQPAQDVVIKSGLPGSPIDPSVLNDGTSSKIGYDATMPPGKEQDFKKVRFRKSNTSSFRNYSQQSGE